MRDGEDGGLRDRSVPPQVLVSQTTRGPCQRTDAPPARREHHPVRHGRGKVRAVYERLDLLDNPPPLRCGESPPSSHGVEALAPCSKVRGILCTYQKIRAVQMQGLQERSLAATPNRRHGSISNHRNDKPNLMAARARDVSNAKRGSMLSAVSRRAIVTVL